jgi:hypothetical protein
MQAVLIGPSGQIILEPKVFTIGSSPDNSLVIDNLKVSAHHAEIRPEGQGFSITDLGSIHGTYVNGGRLDFNAPHLLNQGNSIAIGDIIYTYDVTEAPQTEQTSSTSPKQEVDSGVPVDEHAEMPLYPQAHEMSVMTVPSGNQELIEADTLYALPQQAMPSSPQQIGYMPMIPPGYKGLIPGYVSIEQLRRRDRRFIFMGLGLLIVLALAAVGYSYFTRSTPEKTLDVYCNAIQGQDYQTAFNLLSPSLQGSETELEFAHTTQAGGKVSTCTHSPATTTSNLATANVTLVTSNGQSSSNIITLIMDSGSTWKINMLPSSPNMTLAAFCNALRGKDYPTAYTQLSTDLRRLNAEAQFETDFNGLTCSYHKVSPTGNSASTTVTFTNASGGTDNATVSLSQDSNNFWKIESIQF